MIVARPILVGAPKPRPLTDQGSRGGCRPEEVGQQMTSFRGGQREEWGAGYRLLLGSIRAVVLDRDANQKGIRQEDESDVYIIRNRSGAHYSRITCIIRTVTK